MVAKVPSLGATINLNEKSTPQWQTKSPALVQPSAPMVNQPTPKWHPATPALTATQSTPIAQISMPLVGKSGRNSAEFRDYSGSRPFELRNFHQNFIFPVVKCVPANSELIPAGSESSPAINSFNFMNQKMFLLYLSVVSGIKF